MTAPALQTIDLTVGYRIRRKPQPVLSGLNVCVQPGELVCLIGRNGTGKSTLLRTLSGVQPTLAGAVQIQGRDTRTLTAMEMARMTGVVLTERVTVGALRARQIVELGRYPRVGWTGRLSAGDDAVVAQAIEAVGAAHLADRDSNRLSDGERQRFMIARALAQEPSVLLLDEPAAFLDAPARVELLGLLHGLARTKQLAVVICTHDLELALRMADTLWLVEPGGRFRCGAPEDVIVAGHIETAFQTEGIVFNPKERAFRPHGYSRTEAIVRGDGLAAVLARAVLEREGYSIVATGRANLVVDVESNGSGWTAAAGGNSYAGRSFAELAQALKTRI